MKTPTDGIVAPLPPDAWVATSGPKSASTTTAIQITEIASHD